MGDHAAAGGCRWFPAGYGSAGDMTEPTIGHNGIAGDQLKVSDLVAKWQEQETWRTIQGYDKYRISSWGRVQGPRQTLKPGYVAGYSIVTLMDERSEPRNMRVHRLVAMAFLGQPPFDGAIVAHNDGDRKNNYVANLRWASARENQADRGRHGTRVRGSRVTGSKLQEDDIPVIRSRIANGESYQRIASDFGVDKSTIHLIGINKTWKHVTGAAWAIIP